MTARLFRKDSIPDSPTPSCHNGGYCSQKTEQSNQNTATPTPWSLSRDGTVLVAEPPDRSPYSILPTTYVMVTIVSGTQGMAVMARKGEL